jgi:membrane fusion protein (multidrug efflux system)
VLFRSIGTLKSRQNTMVRPEVAGRVVALGFTDGSQVKAGQMLVQLDDSLQRAEIQQSQAQVSIAQANHKRNQELVAQNFIAQRALDESLANLQVAQAQLSLTCARWQRMRILAPYSGTVGIRTVNVGDFVKDGADLVNLEDLSGLYVDFRLPERYQDKVSLRQTVEVQVDAIPGRNFQARIEAIDPLIDANGRAISVRAVLPNGGSGAQTAAVNTAGKANAAAGSAEAVCPACPAISSDKPVAPGPLRPGMFANVAVLVGKAQSLVTLPRTGVTYSLYGDSVYVVKPAPAAAGSAQAAPADQMIVERRAVKLGAARGARVSILSGLEPGEQVVSEGQSKLMAGARVRVDNSLALPASLNPLPRQ